MSWLLAGFIPALLMLSTVGLQRLESVLHSERPSTGEIAARFESAARAARERAVPLTGVSGLSPRMEPAYRLVPDEPGLPTRLNPARLNPTRLNPARLNPARLNGVPESNTGVSVAQIR